MPKAAEVQNMFDRISGRYDLMNRVMTLGIDQRWRARAIRAAGIDPSSHVLDVCCGTGDITFGLARAGAERVVGVDFSEGMLKQANERLTQIEDDHVSKRIEFIQGDALDLPFEDNTFDALTVSFGVRNVENLAKAFDEFLRVVRPGGRVVCLEITRPKSTVANGFYNVWFDHVVPFVGGIVGRDRAAYKYLPESTKSFPRPPQLEQLLVERGFSKITWESLGGGIVALHRAVVPVQSA